MQYVTHTLTGLQGMGKVEARSLRGLLLWLSRVAKGLPTQLPGHLLCHPAVLLRQAASPFLLSEL